MKKAFDMNVSRAKPRVRLGALMTATADQSAMSAASVEALAQQVASEPHSVIPSRESPDLGAALRARAQARLMRGTAAEALQEAIGAPAPLYARAMPDEVHAREATTWSAPVEAVQPEAPRAQVVTQVEPQPSPRAQVSYGEPQPAPRAPVATYVEPQPVPRAQVAAYVEPQPAPRAQVVAHAEPLPSVTEVQTAPVPDSEPSERDPGERRERLRERLKAVRENPRPEPLPDTVAEAGVLAVERISALQTELAKSRAMNLALAQDLEAARRQAERATEEARMRMDEARRLSTEMESRVTLLSELERELEALEGERNESLLALQESRQVLEVREREKLEFVALVEKKDHEISESLAEEERLAGELELAQESMLSLRRASDALKTERDTLARQVSELTRERAELLEARKALEAVHRALSSAAMR